MSCTQSIASQDFVFKFCPLNCPSHAAFEVEDADAMEARLLFFGIEYTKAVVPGVEAAQLFFFDPEG